MNDGALRKRIAALVIAALLSMAGASVLAAASADEAEAYRAGAAFNAKVLSVWPATQ